MPALFKAQKLWQFMWPYTCCRQDHSLRTAQHLVCSYGDFMDEHTQCPLSQACQLPGTSSVNCSNMGSFC